MNEVWIGSPNYTAGRGGKTIDRIVIHWMVGTLASTDAVFQNTNVGTSAHYGVENNNVHRYVDLGNTAYHAGNWSYNQRSIGIEHSAAPGRDATPATVETSAQLIARLCKQFGIPCNRDHIVKHSQIVATQCCGTIPIDQIVARANEIINGGSSVAIIQNAENWRARVNRTVQLIWGRDFTEAEFQSVVGQDTLKLLEVLEDNPYANVVQSWQNTGKIAIDQGWQEKMVGLQGQIDTLTKQVKDLTAQLAVQSDDTKLLNGFGEFLRAMINRLGLKK